MTVRIFPIKIGLSRLYLIKDLGTILVDSGMPNSVKKFLKSLNLAHIQPNEIKLIVLTHGDVDHTGSAKDIQSLTGAKIAIHKMDQPHLEHSIPNYPSAVTLWGSLLRTLMFPLLRIIFPGPPAVKADLVLDDYDFPLHDFGISGKIIYTPGHTPGSVSVLLETGDAFVGCMAHNGLPFRIGPGLPAFAEEIHRLKESWKPILEGGARMIYPGHGDPFPVEKLHL